MGRAHWVVCKSCVRKFNVEREGGRYDGSRYICNRCYRKIKAAARQQQGLIPTPKPDQPSWFSKYWKLLIGFIFLIGGLGNMGIDWKAALFGILVGIGLLLWHFWPQISTKRQSTLAQNNLSVVKYPGQFNPPQPPPLPFFECNSCGAQTKGPVCEYCGTPNKY